jgi:hypothetical protein
VIRRPSTAENCDSIEAYNARCEPLEARRATIAGLDDPRLIGPLESSSWIV